MLTSVYWLDIPVLQDLRDRTYYLSNGVIRVGGRRVATNAASFTKGDIVGVVLDADQGEIVFLRNGIEQGRARGIRGRLYPFVSFDSEQDQITLLGMYAWSAVCVGCHSCRPSHARCTQEVECRISTCCLDLR